MYIFEVIWSLVVVILTAKLDKKITTLNDGDFEKSHPYDDWFEYYNGRTTGYKIAFVISFVPFANYLTIFVFSAFSIFLIGLRVAKAKFWHSKFWNKLF